MCLQAALIRCGSNVFRGSKHGEPALLSFPLLFNFLFVGFVFCKIFLKALCPTKGQGGLCSFFLFLFVQIGVQLFQHFFLFLPETPVQLCLDLVAGPELELAGVCVTVSKIVDGVLAPGVRAVQRRMHSGDVCRVCRGGGERAWLSIRLWDGKISQCKPMKCFRLL